MSMEKYRVSVVDALIFRDDKVCLQKRAMGMWKDTWVLPGGKVDIGEDLKTAVVREVKEETNMDATVIVMVGIYDDPQRDPEQNGVSVAFLCKADGKPKNNEESTEIKFFSLDDLPENIGFDHEKIINDGRKIYDYIKESKMLKK
jgi:ADP-ribose pyrophosphatase YjhB (NUDIX family)